MISVEEARKTILTKINVLPAEKVFITEAISRCLAEDIISGIDVPPWDNSAMDGYAVNMKDIESVPARLSVSQDIPAGAIPLFARQASPVSSLLARLAVPLEEKCA
jgi:molybdopterin molybdotransferase